MTLSVDFRGTIGWDLPLGYKQGLIAQSVPPQKRWASVAADRGFSR